MKKFCVFGLSQRMCRFTSVHVMDQLPLLVLKGRVFIYWWQIWLRGRLRGAVSVKLRRPRSTLTKMAGSPAADAAGVCSAGEGSWGLTAKSAGDLLLAFPPMECVG